MVVDLILCLRERSPIIILHLNVMCCHGGRSLIPMKARLHGPTGFVLSLLPQNINLSPKKGARSPGTAKTNEFFMEERGTDYFWSIDVPPNITYSVEPQLKGSLVL